MTKSKRMKPVVQVAENREQDAARQLGKSREALAYQQNRLEELLHYREEYSKQLISSQAMDIRKLQEYHVFMSRLNDAIRQQRQIVAQAEKECDTTRVNWVSKRSRTQALNKVVEQYQKEEIREQDRREQKEQDERSGRKDRN